jgi:glycosyltransferase involved in cell wall biosynthesis
LRPTPLLFLSDSPALRTGLGRITRDLATFASQLPQYRVAVLGRGGIGSSRLPFTHYGFPEHAGWGEDVIEYAWRDFSGGQRGAIMTIWDASRLLWFSRPYPEMGRVHRFLTDGHFQRWGYFPVDSAGPRGRLSAVSAAAVSGFDRVLAYTMWGSTVIGRTIGRSVDWIPHGIDGDKFTPRDKKAARMAFGYDSADLVCLCVMTNQTRKDWGCAVAAVAELRSRLPNLRFHIHTDVAERSHAWSIPALLEDFGLSRCSSVTFSGSMDDTEMSYLYSAADFTILPSTEGFGYPIVESLACGVPVFHGSYGGGAELVPKREWLVDPCAERLETINNAVRPVFDPAHWASAIHAYLEGDAIEAEFCRGSVEHLFWRNLWPACWKRWFEEGL